ncbi:AMP-binding protein [Nocardiopsis rhodophaea]|uniref:AMP-binding protein n=1 Tax=Nocardiopsis rhodophaea TaxID=280238 RepID=A0ABN2S5R4_9ACTN
MLVPDLLRRPRTERGDHPAVIDADGTLSYRHLGALVDRAVGWLRLQGVTTGQRVVYVGGNDRAFLTLFYATLRVGAVFVPLHPELTDLQIGDIVDDCAATLAICPPAAGERAGRSVDAERSWREVQRTPADGFAAAAADDSVAMLIYTSGTTGRPKGVVCPHRQMVAAVEAIHSRLRYRADDVVLCRLPLSFDYGLYQALLCAHTGSTLVLAHRGQDVDLVRIIERYGVSVVPLVPSLAQILTLLRRKHRGPTRVRLFTNTGARPSRAVMSDLLNLFPGSAFASMYGMTECKRVSVLDPGEYAAHPESVGRPIPGDHVRIVDGGKRTLGPGEVGEIVVWGATVMDGYWRIPLDAQHRFVRRADGSLELHSGDQGYLDEEGRLYFVGRDDDMFKRRGIRMGLTEIENAAEQLPGVTTAVALRPETEDGPLHLVVQSRLSPEDISAHLAARLDRARMPDQITRLDALPLTANGKPDRAAAKRLVEPPAGARGTTQPPFAQMRTTHEQV